MELLESIEKRRSIRLFKQEPLSDETLMRLVSAAVLSPSGGNGQPLRYVVARAPETVKKVFELTAWAAHVRPHRTPVWGVSSPVAFIAVCVSSGAESNPLAYADAGAAIQSALLRAVELGLGACWLGAFDKAKVADALELEDLGCLYLVALGVPAESPKLDRIQAGQSTKYYLDSTGDLHVPKYEAKAVTSFK